MTFAVGYLHLISPRVETGEKVKHKNVRKEAAFVICVKRDSLFAADVKMVSKKEEVKCEYSWR